MSYQRSYAYAGNGVSFACVETSSQPLPPPEVPGIGRHPGDAIGQHLAGLAAAPSEVERAAASERARLMQVERADQAASAAAAGQRALQARQRRALEAAGATPAPRGRAVLAASPLAIPGRRS